MSSVQIRLVSGGGCERNLSGHYKLANMTKFVKLFVYVEEVT
jgi:hypothetical protein